MGILLYSCVMFFSSIVAGLLPMKVNFTKNKVKFGRHGVLDWTRFSDLNDSRYRR
jgi:hypothetical protein